MTKIVTHYGNIVDLVNPDPSTITLKDIAHNLSRIVRFNGAGKYRYSVAQHSIYVSNLVAPQHALPALMHDATEAYLGDVVSPLKQLLPEYIRIERRMWEAICLAFELNPALSHAVHRADRQAYLKERTTLIGTPIVNDPDIEHFEGEIITEVPIYPEQDPKEVAQDFETRFYVLQGRAVL